jgi:SAM-dependent methyltransferase
VFTDEQYRAIYPDGIECHYWSLARYRIVAGHVRSLLDQADDVILDLGCGRGQCVQYLRKRGFRAIGCDLGKPSPISPAIASFLYLGWNAVELPLVLRSQVRVLLLLDVLEHLPDPARLLSQCMVSFPNCSHLLLTVPARRELWSNYDDYNGHLARYDHFTLPDLYRGMSVRLQYAGYFFHGLYLPAFALARLGMNRSTQLRSPPPSLRWLHRLIAAGFVAEERVLPRTWVGSSLLAVLRREALSTV